MAQCPAGGQPVGGAPASFWAFASDWFIYLLNRIPGVAVLLSPFIAPTLYITADFCAIEPVIPAAPSFADYAAAVLGNPDAQQRVVQYWKQNYLASIWPTYCQ